MKCKECNKELKNLKALTTHIQFKHNNEQHQYYNKWIKQDIEGFCKYCGKPTKFDSMHYGYQTYCSRKCFKQDFSDIKTINNPMHSKEAKQHQRETNLKRYNVTQNTKRPEIKQQIIDTNKKVYGVENVSQDPTIKAKALKSRETTNMKNHGVKSSLSVPYVKTKIKRALMINHGVESPMQNQEIFNKAQKTRFLLHKFKDKNLFYQGSYELHFLDTFFDKFPDITRGPSIKYMFDNKIKIHHPDFYIPSLNLIIEIKNSYLYKRYYDSIKAKEKGALKMGYDYIVIIEKDYSVFSHKCLITR